MRRKSTGTGVGLVQSDPFRGTCLYRMATAMTRPVSFADLKEFHNQSIAEAHRATAKADNPLSFEKTLHRNRETGGVSAYKSTWRMCAGFLFSNIYFVFPPRVCFSEELMNLGCLACDYAIPSCLLPTAPATCNVRLLGLIPIPCCIAKISQVKETSGCLGLMRILCGCVNPMGDEYICCPRLASLEPDVIHLGKKDNMHVCFGCCVPGLLSWNWYCLRPCSDGSGSICKGDEGCHTLLGTDGCVMLGCIGFDCSFPCSHSIPSTFGILGFVTKCHFCAKAGSVASRVDMKIMHD